MPPSLDDLDRGELLRLLFADLPEPERGVLEARARALFRAGYRTAGVDPPAWLRESTG